MKEFIHKSTQKKIMIGQRCKGRNFDGRRCCTPENPCGEGEGDCDGAGDGGLNDGDKLGLSCAKLRLMLACLLRLS